jgi:hypothetical protein
VTALVRPLSVREHRQETRDEHPYQAHQADNVYRFGLGLSLTTGARFRLGRALIAAKPMTV